MRTSDVVHVLVLGSEDVKVTLEAESDIVIERVARTVEIAAEMLREIDVDAAIINVHLWNSHVPHVVRTLRARDAETPVIVMGAPPNAAAALETLQAGSLGYIPDTATGDRVRESVRAVAQGRPSIPPELIGPMMEAIGEHRSRRDNALARLQERSAREREVLAGLLQGLPNDEIAQLLGISPQTVRKHVEHILRKLGVHSRLEAVAFVHRGGIEDALSAQHAVAQQPAP